MKDLPQLPDLTYSASISTGLLHEILDLCHFDSYDLLGTVSSCTTNFGFALLWLPNIAVVDLMYY